MKRHLGFLLSSAAMGVVLVSPIGATAAGLYSTLPVVGQPAIPGGSTTGYTGLSTQTGTGPGTGGPINSTTVPAGPPSLTGTELIPADTGLANSAPPQTVTIPSSLLGNATNRLIGGDFTTNLAQRLNTAKGVTALASTTPTAAIITADRWWVVSPAAHVTTTIDSTFSTANIPALGNTKALRVARTSGQAGGVICVGQTLDAGQAAPLIGNNAVFSFWLKNGSTQSATNGNVVANIDYTTVADITTGAQATLGYAGTNGALFAQLDTGGTITGLTNGTQAVGGFSPGTTGTLTAGLTNGYSATIAASTTWTRYSVWANIPATVTSSSTAVTEVSVSVCFTPAASTSVATDYIEVEGLEVEAKPATVTASLPNGVISPTSFERRSAATEQLLQYYYWYFVYENQSLVTPVPYSRCTTTTSTTAGVCQVDFPVAMRIPAAVKYTDGFQAFTSTAYTAVGALNTLATYNNTLTTVPSTTGVMFSIVASTLPAVGTANFLMQLGTSSATGIISASAEP